MTSNRVHHTKTKCSLLIRDSEHLHRIVATLNGVPFDPPFKIIPMQTDANADQPGDAKPRR